MERLKEVLRSERSSIIIAAVLLSLILTTIACSSFLLRSGVANEGDLTWPYFNEAGLTGLYREGTQSGILPNQMIVYSWLFNLPVDTAIQERLLFLGTFMLMGTVCYYVTFRLLQHEGAEKRLNYILSGAATAAYVFCPLNIYHIEGVFLLIGYALLPALLYAALRFVWSDRSGKDILAYGVLTGAILAVSSGDPRWPVWGLFIVAFLLLLMVAMDRFKGAVRTAGYLSVAIIAFFALSMFWILPTLLVPEQATLLARPNLSVNFFFALNKYATLSNALTFQADFWTPTRELFSVSNPVLNLLFQASQFVLPALALMSIIFFRRNRLVMPLLVISAAVLVIATAPLSPFSLIREGYHYFVFNIPFGIAFRTSYKWLVLLSYPLVILASYTILGVARGMVTPRVSQMWDGVGCRKIAKHVAPGLAVILVAASLIATWPMVAGDFGGLVSPVDLSSDYKEAYGLIDDQARGDYDFKILYLPSNPYTGFAAPGLTDSPYLHYILTKVDQGNLSELGGFLAPLGVRFVLVDKTAYYNDVLENELKNQTDLSNLYEGEQLLVLENEQYSGLFRFSDQAINFDGIDSGAVRAVWDDWIQTDQAMLGLQEAFNSTPYVIIGSGYPYDLMVSGSITSSPFLYVPYYGDESWQFQTAYNPSAAGTHIIRSYDWINLLNSMGLENWNLDYGEGLAFVNKNLTIPEDLPLPDSALVRDYDLSDFNTVQEFVESNYPEQFGAKQVLSWEGENVKVKLFNSTSGWKTVRSPMVEVNTNQTYSVMTKIRSQSGFDIHFKIAEYDGDGNLLSVKPYYGLGSGEIDWTTVRLNYQAEDPEVKYISLQIWHGSDTTTPLPNTFWIEYVSVYNTTGLLMPPQIDGKVTVDESGQYRLYVRTLNSPLGGNVTVSVDGTTVKIGTRSDATTLSWAYCGKLDLAPGVHDVTVRNGDGVNAVNLVSLMRDEEYNALLSQFNSQLADKSLIYVLQPNVSGAALAINNDSSYGPIDQYLVANKEIEIFRTEDYRVYAGSENMSSLYVDGEFIGTLGGEEMYVTVHLDVGRHNVTVLSAEEDYLAQEILMFSANAGDDLDELDNFYRADEQLLDVSKEGTSIYKLNMTAEGSSFLVFTHAFDSGWKLSSSDGSAVRMSSIPVNTAENGFIVHIDGNASLVLTYSPDHLYGLGAAISMASAMFIAIPAVILYIWGGRLRVLSSRLRIRRSK